MKIHEVKTNKEYFEAACAGVKLFTIRFDDRNYAVGDVLRKIEVDSTVKKPTSLFFVEKVGFVLTATGRTADFEITYKLENIPFGLEPGYCILGLKKL